jgi:hypothetical protein
LNGEIALALLLGNIAADLDAIDSVARNGNKPFPCPNEYPTFIRPLLVYDALDDAVGTLHMDDVRARRGGNKMRK